MKSLFQKPGLPLTEWVQPTEATPWHSWVAPTLRPALRRPEDQVHGGLDQLATIPRRGGTRRRPVSGDVIVRALMDDMRPLGLVSDLLRVPARGRRPDGSVRPRQDLA